MSEPEVSQKNSRKRPRWHSLAALAVILLCWSLAAWRYYRIAAVQDALSRDYEISFGREPRPFGMPEALDNAVRRYLGGKGETWKRSNPEIVYGERVRGIFRGSIKEMGIYYHEGFSNELGTALLRFPELKRLAISETDPHKGDYKLLCEDIRRLRNLEELELGGAQINDDAIGALAGHPKLEKLNVSYSVFLTPDVLLTLKSLPKLGTLEIGDVYGPGEKAWRSPEVLARFREQLPGVKVTLPQP